MSWNTVAIAAVLITAMLTLTECMKARISADERQHEFDVTHQVTYGLTGMKVGRP